MTPLKHSETPEPEQLKIAGMEAAANKYRPDLVRAQLIAEMLGINGDAVNSDMVRAEFLKHYQRELRIGNAMGSLFDDDKWVCVGRVKSERREAHGRSISKWRLKQYVGERE